jgi:putative ATP-dependent endonuclease of OLD family
VYISHISLTNYRCFGKAGIDFRPGVNVIIGENNAGKTALLAAMGQVFNHGGRRRPHIHDFFQGISDFSGPPVIEIAATLHSSPKDTLADKALVATWLTKVEAPWEAQLTYRCFLPEKEADQFRDALGGAPDKERFWRVLEDYLPKFVARVYGGNPADQAVVEGEALARFRYQFVDALRDVQTTMFSGQDPLLREMLRQILDAGADAITLQDRRTAFEAMVTTMHTHIVDRLDLNTLFQLVTHTGAGDGGNLGVEGRIAEAELLAALRLIVEREGVRLPVAYNGLGYNNLVYISLLLSKMDYESDTKKLGDDNAVIFPMLVVEEPEAHLHPALQYKLLKYLRKRIEGSAKSRQVFITTHSTHITSASRLDDIVCLAAPVRAGMSPEVSYPGRVFPDDVEGRKSKKYVERFLDATKSNMLFARSVVLVEGLAEQLVLPYLAEYAGHPFEESHVALVRVDGSTFRHFLPLFGACPPELRKYSLSRRVACVVDADPCRKVDSKGERWKSCWPYEEQTPAPSVDYLPVAAVASGLVAFALGVGNILVRHGLKTFEYDLAEANPAAALLVTPTCRDADELLAYCATPTGSHPVLEARLDAEAARTLPAMADAAKRARARFATYYLLAVEEAKGEHAFDLSVSLREDLALGAARKGLVVPAHIEEAIAFVTDAGARPAGTAP